MGNRPEVKTAPAPIVALDVTLLAQQLTVALARVPFRRPFHGDSTKLSNLGASVTREVVRSFMGLPRHCASPSSARSSWSSTTSAVRNAARRHHPRGREPTRPSSAACRASSTSPRGTHRSGCSSISTVGGYIGTSPNMYAFFTARPVPRHRLRRVRRRLPARSGVPLPRRRRGRLGGLRGVVARSASQPNGSSWAGTPAAADWPTRSCSPPRAGGTIPPGRAYPVLPRGGPPARRTVGERERRPRHPAVEHPDGLVPARHQLRPTTGLPARRRPHHFPPTCVTWGGNEMFRDPIRRYVRQLRRRRRVARGAGVRRDVPRVPDPHAVGPRQPDVFHRGARLRA